MTGNKNEAGEEIRRKTVTEGAVRAQHDIIKSSFHLLSDHQPLKLEHPDVVLKFSKVHRHQAHCKTSFVNLKLKT